MAKSKYTREGGNAFDSNSSMDIVQRGVVVSTHDPNDAGRIKVRVLGLDNDTKDPDIINKEMFYAFPMIPKHIGVMPQVGEAVYIFNFSTDSKFVDRMYVGPVISQPDKLEFQDAEIGAWDGFSFRVTDLGPATINNKKLRGGFPEKEDIAIQGRKNSDIIFKKNEVVLRAGKFVYKGDASSTNVGSEEFDDKFDFIFNKKTQGYIQIRYDAPISVPKDENDKQEFGSVTSVVSNKIFLLTHKDGNPRFNLTNQNNLISNEEIEKMLNEAHPLIFGDKLVEVLKLVLNAINNHVHPYHGDKWDDLAGATTIKDLNDYNLSDMISKNIMIN